MANIQVISSKIGHIINNFTDWRQAFIEIDNEKHWKEGRSAWALAKYFTNPTLHESNGILTLEKYLQNILTHHIIFSHGEIEHESKFDSFQGSGRKQDLIIWGYTNNQNLVICIEAKVDETFGNNIEDEYKRAEDILKNNPRSKRKERIKNLCSKFYPNTNIESLFCIKYQLLHYLAGSIIEAKKINGIAYMPVMVFLTLCNDSKRSEINKKDYYNFINSLNFEAIPEEKETYKIEIDGVTVYTSYIEIMF